MFKVNNKDTRTTLVFHLKSLEVKSIGEYEKES